MEITPETAAVGLIGRPVGHSLSPALHNEIYRFLGLDLVYIAFDVNPDQVDRAAEGMAALGFLGFNVTIPHKERVVSALDALDPLAEAIGAVNTVKIESGRLIGYNTDGLGFFASLRRQGITVKDKHIAILGAGGSARAIGMTAAFEQAAAVTIVNRTRARAQALRDAINDRMSISIAHVSDVLPQDTELCIHATALGMSPRPEGNFLAGVSLPPGMVVCDIVYNPRETALMRSAQQAGLQTVGGVGMLVGQGLEAIRIWTGISPSEALWSRMLAAASKRLPETRFL